jgi:hypothetical protein
MTMSEEKHITKLIRLTDNGMLCFWCPGCKEAHGVDLKRWTWNGDRERPTLQPSVLITSGHLCPGFQPGEDCWCTYNAAHADKPAPFECSRCHVFVTNGQIQFLNDCTHSYAGRTVALEAF